MNKQLWSLVQGSYTGLHSLGSVVSTVSAADSHVLRFRALAEE